MANTLNPSFGSQTSTTNTTEFWPIFGGGFGAGGSGTINPSPTETDLQVIFRSAGTLSNMWIRLTANSTSSTTVTSRKNAAPGNQSISVGASATGTFTDSTHTDTIANGDKVAIRTVPAATGSFTMSLNAFTFAATTDTVSRLVCVNSLGNNPNTGNNFYPLEGVADNLLSSTTEAKDKIRQRKAGTIKNGAINVFNNGGGVTFTLKSRKNGANGTISISITSNGTGFFEDTTHSDSVVAGDDYCWNLDTTSAGGTFDPATFQVDFVSTNGDCEMVCSHNENLTAVNKAVTTYYGLAGDLAATSTTEANTQLLTNAAITFSELTINLSANTVSATSTLTLRIGAADSALTASITSNTTGIFSDSTHSVTTATTDLVNNKLATGGTGTSLMPQFIAVWGNLATGPAILIDHPVLWNQQISIPYNLVSVGI